MAQAFKTAPTRIESRSTGPLVADRGRISCLPPAPLRIRLDDADGPTNARAGGIRLVEGKARTEFDPYPSFSLSSRKWGSPKFGPDHPHVPSMFLPQTDDAAGARG
jgi:hypothetical protein